MMKKIKLNTPGKIIILILVLLLIFFLGTQVGKLLYNMTH